MNGLDANDWQNTICEFQKNITDSVITEAVHDFPPAIYSLNGRVIEEKLKSRRDLLMDEAMKYYEFLSEDVNVVGSNEQEYFHVSNSGKALKVDMFSKTKSGDTSFLIYSTVFDPEITNEVRLYGLNGDDLFKVDDDVQSKIRLRIIGGKGTDTFNLQGNVSKYVYDLKSGGNYLVKGQRVRNRLSNKPEVNDFNYKAYEYGSTQRYPYITGGYNTDDGILGGLVYTYRTYGFRKEPYATENRLWGLYSFMGKAYQFKYNGTFIDLYKGLDILTYAEMQDPVLYNFFGLGNETVAEKGKPLMYYNARFNFVQADILFRQRFFKNKLSISVGPTLYHYWNHPEDNQNKILDVPELAGLDYKSVYDNKTYLGVKANVNVNNLNNIIFPTRGVQWNNEFLHQRGLGLSAKSFTRFQSDMTVYASLSDPANVVAVLRFGGGKIFSDSFEYFQAVNLGSNNYLRGFRKNRFSGSSSLYNSVELRIKLLDVRSRIVPGTLGLIVFNDIGRVWYKDEDSDRWHDAYGGGLYFLPFRSIILSATVGRSAEETVFNFTVGTKLNLTF